ncbi:MAG: hypothetical protein AAFS10_10670 [Myxococcota bacterium]
MTHYNRRPRRSFLRFGLSLICLLTVHTIGLALVVALLAGAIAVWPAFGVFIPVVIFVIINGGFAFYESATRAWSASWSVSP